MGARSGDTVIVRIGANAILCRGGDRRGRCPTDVAGVVAILLTVRGYSVSRIIAFSTSTMFGGRKSASRVTQGLKRGLAVRRYLCTIVLRSTGRYTCTITRRIKRGLNNSCQAFVSQVGGHTGRLKYASARFGGYGNLPSRSR